MSVGRHLGQNKTNVMIIDKKKSQIYRTPSKHQTEIPKYIAKLNSQTHQTKRITIILFLTWFRHSRMQKMVD